jgi:hypothetical protein
MKLKPIALGLALGIIWALCVFVATLWTLITCSGGQHLCLLSLFYLGYSVSVAGAFIGLVWGFIDGFIAGLVLALLYNLFAKEKGEAKAA